VRATEAEESTLALGKVRRGAEVGLWRARSGLTRRGAVVKAYVLIQAEPGKTGAVVETMLQVKGLISAEGVTGPYDVVALVQAASLDQLSRRVIGSIQAIEGVIRILPCTPVRL
jgi:DNA-binding Lrp family transcriptional regulator